MVGYARDNAICLRLAAARHRRCAFRTQVFNGFSVMLTGDSAKRAADLETLRALPGVSCVSRARCRSEG